MRKKNKVGEIILPDSISYYSYNIKRGWYWRNIDKQIKGTKQSSSVDPHLYCQLTQKRCKNVSWGKRIVFSLNDARIIGYPYTKMNLDYYFTSYTKTNSKQIREIKERPKIIKFLE